MSEQLYRKVENGNGDVTFEAIDHLDSPADLPVRCKEWWIQKNEYHSLAPTAWDVRQKELIGGELIEGQIRVIEPLSYEVVEGAILLNLDKGRLYIAEVMYALKELGMIADDKLQIEKEE